MNKSTRDIVKDIANDVRDWCEWQAEDVDYNVETLEGWCAIASAELHTRLLHASINADLHMWESGDGPCHCFVVVDDYVVDVTATQFKEFHNRPILIMHYKEAEVYEYYRSTHTFGRAKDLRRYQKREGWPKYQIAY
jgi:hypothetical protein